MKSITKLAALGLIALGIVNNTYTKKEFLHIDTYIQKIGEDIVWLIDPKLNFEISKKRQEELGKLLLNWRGDSLKGGHSWCPYINVDNNKFIQALNPDPLAFIPDPTGVRPALFFGVVCPAAGIDQNARLATPIELILYAILAGWDAATLQNVVALIPDNWTVPNPINPDQKIIIKRFMGNLLRHWPELAISELGSLSKGEKDKEKTKQFVEKLLGIIKTDEDVQKVLQEDLFPPIKEEK